MTIPEQIAARSREIEVAAGKLSETLIRVREQGGQVYRMDVKGSKYTLKIYWNEPEVKQQELI